MGIEFREVYYSYDISIEDNILRDINLKFEDNKINVIMGNNGSGKTTMIEMINALLIPVSGRISVGNFELMNKKKYKNINELRFDVGLVFQFPEEQFFKPTVKEEIEFGMKYFKYKLDNISKRVKDSLYLVGLDESYLEKSPFELSSGEQRKVAIASVLAFNPGVLILDEPFVGLDDRSKKKLIGLIRILKAKYNKTIIIVSHDVDLMYQLGDYFIFLDRGKVLKSENKERIFYDITLFESKGIEVPKVVKFIDLVKKEKGITLDPYDNIKDLIKSVYRNV